MHASCGNDDQHATGRLFIQRQRPRQTNTARLDMIVASPRTGYKRKRGKDIKLEFSHMQVFPIPCLPFVWQCTILTSLFFSV